MSIEFCVAVGIFAAIWILAAIWFFSAGVTALAHCAPRTRRAVMLVLCVIFLPEIAGVLTASGVLRVISWVRRRNRKALRG